MVGQIKAACDPSEIMISAYCTGNNATTRTDGMTGAECDGDLTPRRSWPAPPSEADAILLREAGNAAP